MYGKRQSNIFKGRERVKQVEALKDESQLFPSELQQQIGFVSRHILASDIDMSRCGAVDGGNTVEKSCLSAAGRLISWTHASM